MDAARNPRSCGLAAVLEGADSRGRVLLGMRRLRLPPPEKGSAIEFGVKNRESRLALLSPVQRSPAAWAARTSEAEEEYTCVIARGGPNPRMTHIFHGRAVVQSSCHGCCCQLSSCCCDNNNRVENAFVVNQCSYPEVFLDKGIRDTPDGEKLKA